MRAGRSSWGGRLERTRGGGALGCRQAWYRSPIHHQHTLLHGGLGPTYTALGGSALLLDVQIAELTTGGLDHADLLALRVVWRTSPLPIISSMSKNSIFSPYPSEALRARRNVRR